MSDALTTLVFAIGFGGWVYSYMMKSTMRQETSLIAGGVAAVGGAIVIFTLLKFVFHF